MNSKKAADIANDETSGRSIGSATAICFAAAVAGITIMVVMDKVDGVLGLAAVIGFPVLMMLVDLYVQHRDIKIDEMKVSTSAESAD